MTDLNKDKEIDWSLGTWKGSRRRQHEEFQALPFSRKLEIIEGMNAFVENRRHAPQAGKSAVVREQPEED